MSTQSAPNNHELENAFSTFNGLSEQLATTYNLLVSQVQNLESELVKSRDQRLQELAEKERLADRLSRLLDALPGGVVVLDRNGSVIEGNPVAFELLGEPLLDQAWISIIQRAFVPQIDAAGELALHDGRRLSISTCPFGDQAGQVVLLQDVTESRRQQQQVNRLRRLSEMGEMTARLAHQIRTPLASALLYVSHLNANKDQDANAITQEKIRARLRHLEKLVNDMLVFARGDCQGSDIVEVDQLMREVSVNSEEIASGHGCLISLDLQAGSATVLGNREVLYTALQNLINNAIEACQGKGEVNLTDTSRVALRLPPQCKQRPGRQRYNPGEDPGASTTPRKTG